ncbi:MAG: HIT domain-containing protein [Spirochaetes bacterium]|nr:HIT domain-containing protein [Spirochaetota bacterium]
MRDHLFNTEKLKYVKGEKPDVACVLCAIRDGDRKADNLEVARRDGFIVSVNLYPFNPGHVMIFPERHVETLQDLSDGEALALHRLAADTLRFLTEEFRPDGFNVGYNLGKGSGASVPHLHLHIVPRYANEVGFLDVLAGTRLTVVDPAEARDRLRKRFASL